MINPIKKFREENNLSIGDFALRVGVSRPTIVKIERGERNPSLSLAAKIEEVTDGFVTVSMLAQATSKEAISQ